MARRAKYDPEKRRKLPEPRYHQTDDAFEELTRDVATEQFMEPGEDVAEKGFAPRRSKRPFEAAKEQEEEEESLKRQPEYANVKRTRRRSTKRS